VEGFKSKYQDVLARAQQAACERNFPASLEILLLLDHTSASLGVPFDTHLWKSVFEAFAADELRDFSTDLFNQWLSGYRRIRECEVGHFWLEYWIANYFAHLGVKDFPAALYRANSSDHFVVSQPVCGALEEKMAFALDEKATHLLEFRHNAAAGRMLIDTIDGVPTAQFLDSHVKEHALKAKVAAHTLTYPDGTALLTSSNEAVYLGVKSYLSEKDSGNRVAIVLNDVTVEHTGIRYNLKGMLFKGGRFILSRTSPLLVILKRIYPQLTQEQLYALFNGAASAVSSSSVPVHPSCDYYQ
jgi:hypothetical protein